MATLIDDLLASIKTNAGKLSDGVPEFLNGYADWLKKSDTAKTAEEYRAYLASIGTTVKDDVYNTGKKFLDETDTGKAISNAAGKTWDAAQSAGSGAGKFFSSNAYGLGAGAIGALALLLFTENPLLAALGGVVVAAIGNFFDDRSNSLISTFLPKPAPTPGGETAKTEAGTAVSQAATVEPMSEKAQAEAKQALQNIGKTSTDIAQDIGRAASSLIPPEIQSIAVGAGSTISGMVSTATKAVSNASLPVIKPAGQTPP